MRQRASRELARLGKMAESPLRNALLRSPSLEVRRRARDLLAKMAKQKRPRPTPERLRALRTIEVLEYIGSAPAKELLKQLASESVDFWIPREAKAALERLAKRQ
jgi:hypothetical protein